MPPLISTKASPPRSCVVIPARFASTRLPGKMLLRETGQTLLQHTYDQASQAKLPGEVCVATDHEEIAREVRKFGGRALLTDPGLRSGTDRVAAAAQFLPDMEIFVNVQGDEPEIPPEAIDLVIATLASDPRADMATVAAPIHRREVLEDPACVKVVCDQQGRALYFSRSPIPFVREWREELLRGESSPFQLHLGLYAYRRRFLEDFAALPPSPLEELEKLEQLRVLHAGHAIQVATLPEAHVGIDTPEDYQAFVARHRASQSSRKSA